MVKLASWDQFHLEKQPALDLHTETGFFLWRYKVPTSDKYFVRGGADKVLIHIDPHIEQNYRDAICNLVNYFKGSGRNKLTACILRLYHVMVLNITKDPGGIHVQFTIPEWIHSSSGRYLLISTLSPAVKNHFLHPPC
jgi:hypothetical protein